jgi:hypothetical protein
MNIWPQTHDDRNFFNGHYLQGWNMRGFFSDPSESLSHRFHAQTKTQDSMLEPYSVQNSSTLQFVEEPEALKPVFGQECIVVLAEWTVASTKERFEADEPPKIYIENILRNVSSDDLEVGAETAFSLKLAKVIRFFGESAIDIFYNLLETSSYNDEILSCVIRIVGNIENESLRERQLRFLILGLGNPSPLIRDSSALALSDLEDIAAIAYLKEAMSREKYSMLKEDYSQIISELEELHIGIPD